MAKVENYKQIVDEKIKDKKVMMFSKSTCPFCTKAKKVFQKYLKDGTLSSEDYEVMEIERDPQCGAIQNYLKEKTGASSVPRVFVNEKFIGGGDDVVALDGQGKLLPMLKSAAKA